MNPLFLMVALATQDTSRADAYLDPGARELVAHARGRREREERLVTAYQATVTQRIGVGIRALRRDRMLFHQEISARIEWRRDSTTRIEVLGARQAIPIAIRGVQVPDDLADEAGSLAFDPSTDYLRLLGDQRDGFVHPLAVGSEGDYRFASGDTNRITLPDGRDIRLVELRFTARRAEFRLMSGSMWFDADSYGIVRAVWRPARPFDMDLDTDRSDHDGDHVPSVLKPIRAEVRYVTIEYGLYGSRWWLPRLLALDAEATMGTLMRVPVRFEQLYVVTGVQGGTEPPVGLRHRAAGSVERGSRERDDSTAMDPDSLAAAIARCVETATAVRDSAEAPDADRPGLRVHVGPGPDGRAGPRGAAAAGRTAERLATRRRARRCTRQAKGLEPDLVVVVPRDTMGLLTSPTLGAPVLDMGDVISETELRDLGHEIGALPQQPWQFRSSLSFGPAAGLVRYNRVEALSVGARASFDLGRLQLDGMARIGVGDLSPNAEIGLTRPAQGARYRLAGYRRLAAVDPNARSLGIGNSLTSLLFGRDDGDYFRATGIELTGAPGPTGGSWYAWRVFAERQDSVKKETDASLPHLFDAGRGFRPTIVAARADQLGGSLTLRGYHAYRSGAGLGADVTAEAQRGDFDFGRGALTTRLTLPLGSRVLGLELAAGTSTGAVPVQSFFYLGGPSTLRGYGGNAASGPSFWRARAELGAGIPGARLAVFGDAGWAGPRAQFGKGSALVAAGIGASFLDGLIRMDLGRAMRTPRGWRMDFYADGVL